MAPIKPKPRTHTTAADSTQAVDTFMANLEHAFKSEIQLIRRSILSVDSHIAEGIKWNAPSFRTAEYFATVNLREKKGIGVILHLGAKVREISPDGVSIKDPQELLKWLAKDRAMIVFKDMSDLKAKKAAFEEIVRCWIGHV